MMCDVKQCLLILLYSVQIYHFVSSNQEICDHNGKSDNKTTEAAEKKTKTVLQPRYNPYLDEGTPTEDLMKNFNFNYFDQNRIKSKDDFYAMSSDEIGIPMARPPQPKWQAEGTAYRSGPQVLPDVVMTPEEPLRRKLAPEVLADDEKQLGRFLVEDTRRVIHMMHPNDEYKGYRPLLPSPGYSYRHPSGISYPYSEPTRYNYQPRPHPYGYVNSQRNYINKEFDHPAYQSSGPLLTPPLPGPSMYSPPVPHPVGPPLPIYKTPPMHHSIPATPSSPVNTQENMLPTFVTNTVKGNADTLDNGIAKSEGIINPAQLPTFLANAVKEKDKNDAVEAKRKDDSSLRIELDLDEQTNKAKGQADVQVNPEIPIAELHPAALEDHDPKTALEGEKRIDSPVELSVDKNSEKSDDLTAELFKQLQELLKSDVSQRNTSLVEGDTSNLKVESSNDPTAEILKQLEDLLKHEEPQLNTTLVGGDINSLKPESSMIDGILKGDNPEETAESLKTNTLPVKRAPGKDYTDIINAIMKTDNIADLVNNPLITTDALKEIAQQLNIQQGNEDSLSPLLNDEQNAIQFREEKDADPDVHNAPDITKADHYTDVISAIIETDKVEDLVNNPNIATDVLKEIAEILDTEQDTPDSGGNLLNLTQLANEPLSPLEAVTGAIAQALQETNQIRQIEQESFRGLNPIGIETESGEVLPMPNFIAPSASDANGRTKSGCPGKKPTTRPRRRSKTLAREDEGKELYFMGNTNKLVRIPKCLLEKPLLSKLIAAKII